MNDHRIEEVADALRRVEARLAAQQALLDERLLRVEHNRLFTAWNAVVGTAGRVWRRLAPRLHRSVAAAASDAIQYATWVAHESAALPSPAEARNSMAGWNHVPVFSIILPPGGTPSLVKPFVRSVAAQVYGKWELLCDGYPDDRDPRVRNATAQEAAGDYLIFANPSGLLSPFALYYFAEALQTDPNIGILYADEDLIDAAGQRSRPIFRPGWSPALFRSCHYIGSFVGVSRACLDNGRAEDPMTLLERVVGDGARVRHTPRVLYHAAEALNPQIVGRRGDPGKALEATVIVCSRTAALVRTCLASVRTTGGDTVRRIIVVAHEETGRNEALRSAAATAGAEVLSFSGPFNFAQMNNAAAELVSTPAIIFLNDDVEATHSGWASTLTAWLNHSQTAIAGAVLWYPDGGLQHAGIVAGMSDGVAHAGRGASGSAIWPWLLMTRNVSAVTGACLAVRSGVFRELGGFDPVFPNNYNDVDLCFRARAMQYEVVCVAAEGLIHSECRTRHGIVRFDERYRFFRRWEDVLSRPDPYYSMSLAPTEKIVLNLSDHTGARDFLIGSV